MKIIFKLIKIPKLFDSDANLISNIAVNKLLSPFYFLFMFYFVHYIYKKPIVGLGNSVAESLVVAFLGTIFYIWCSYFYQPDLDVRLNRPGMNAFPFGAILMNSQIGFILVPIQFVIGRTWYYFWQPYAELCTHRGVSHWPIISVWYRAAYILLNISIVQMLLNSLGVSTPIFLLYIKSWASLFFPFSSGFGFKNIAWVLFCFPVFVSDIAHEVIDYVDSKRKGLSYCPPQIARGYFYKIHDFAKTMIKKKSI